MSVTATITPVIVPLSSIDRRFPLGIWNGRSTLAGDASAGTATVTFQWSQNSPSLVFSLEFVTIRKTGTAANEVARVQLDTRILSSSGTGLDFLDALTLLHQPTFATADVVKGYKDILPFFSPQVTNSPWTLAVGTTNPGAGQNLLVDAMGYIWDAESLKLAGGPVRPGVFPQI